MIHPSRVSVLVPGSPAPGAYVLLWMQQAQRIDGNHAWAFAVDRANELGLPLVTWTGVRGDIPHANARHMTPFLEGLRELVADVRVAGAHPVVHLEGDATTPDLLQLARDAALVVTDRGSLRWQREWRAQVAAALNVPFVEVETDVVVPVEAASPKQEYSAATLRRKITPLLDTYLVPLAARTIAHRRLGASFASTDLGDISSLLRRLRVDASVPVISTFRGGAAAAKQQLRVFLADRLDRFAEERNDPSRHALSGLSPYLHYGHIAPLDVALAVRASGSPGADAFLEELIVRRELARNFVWYNPYYEGYGALPPWAQATLDKHRADPRPYLYDASALEAGATHDPAWNAAQLEMVWTGTMHGYMRMYWGKKILEWSASPEEAYRTAVRLNDRYELDGRDANGYAGVGWCFGLHDRPWGERPVFGMVRCMVAAGLRRKFDVEAYIASVRARAPDASSASSLPAPS